MMRKGWLTGVEVLAVAGALALGQPPAAAAQRAITSGTLKAGTLSFDGRATMGDFVGTTTTVSGEMTGGASLAAVRGWVEAPVNTLTTGNGRRDKDLNKSVESDKYPTIRFDLTGVRIEWERNDSAGVELAGNFTIHGVTRDVTVPALLLFEADTVHLTSTLPMNLKDYHIGHLSKMLGILKMHPDIVVHVDVRFVGH